MNNSVYYISLDIHDTASQTMLNVKKSDNGRQINFVLTDGGKPYVITEGCKAYFRALKPSKENLLFNECTIANNVITYILTNQTSAEVGIVDCEIRLNGADGKQITSPRFSLCVEDIIYSDSEVESRDEFTALQTAIIETNNLDVSLSKANGMTAITVTKKDGTKVTKTVYDGEDGVDGKDGVTPHIGVNGDWYIGNEDTGKPSRGERGEKGDKGDVGIVTVDAELSATSENPVQNKAVKAALDKKVDKVEGKGLSTNDYTDEDKAEVAKVASKADISNPLSLSDTDKTKDIVLIQHNYDSKTSTERYVARSIDINNLSESGLNAYNIPTSKAVINWVKSYIDSLNANEVTY